MNTPKVITICGSLKFIPQIKEYSEKLELAGNCVLSIVYPTKPLADYTPSELELLGQLHFQRIAMSDEIFVVNVGGYIGDSTRREIQFAQQQGITVNYLEPLTM